VKPLREETGLVGKMVVVWLLVLALVAVAAIDAASIAFTTYQLSDVGSTAATEGARVYRQSHDAREACERVATIVTGQEPAARLTRDGCRIERPTGLVTVALRKTASTLVAERLSWTEEFATVVVTESAGPPAL
jgi:hypothetical protein